MLQGLTIKIIGTFMDLGLPWILAFIIDEVTPKKDIVPIILWGSVMVLLSITTRQFNVRANQMASSVAKDATKEIREDLFDKVVHMSSSQVDDYSIPSLITRLTTDTYNIHQMIGMMQRLGVRAPLILIGGMTLTMTLEPVLSMIVCVLLPLLGLCVYCISKRGIPLFQETQRANDHLVRTVRENVIGIRVIKALSKETYEMGRFEIANDSMVYAETNAQKSMAITGPIMNLLLNFGLTLVVVVGALRVNGGYTEVGKIVAFLSYFTIMLQSMMAITRIFVIYSKSSASAQRIAAVLREEVGNTIIEEVRSQELNTEDEFYIQFLNVDFSYDKEGTQRCLNNIDVSLRKGESLGIIGATGSGKTTIVNLLLRLYDPDSGRILIEGKDIRTIPTKKLRERFGVVFQNDTIFGETIASNIDFNRGLSMEQIVAASTDAQASEFIEGCDQGYKHLLAAKGTNLSGGQKQRLLISRALAGNPDILILDDSSSALDYKTDAKLRKALREQYQDTTMIMIAQRISSIRSLSKIMVLEDGEMIGLGTHEELLASCSVYQEIYQLQMGEQGENGGTHDET